MWLLEAHPSFNYALVQSYHTRVIKFLRSELLLIFCAIPRGCPVRAWKATGEPGHAGYGAGWGKGRQLQVEMPGGGCGVGHGAGQGLRAPVSFWRASEGATAAGRARRLLPCSAAEPPAVLVTLALQAIYPSGWFILLSGVGLTGQAPPPRPR